MELFLLSVIGLVLGIAVGLIPTIGPFLTMLMTYPLLIGQDPLAVICFYVSMITAANFSGSVTGILFGVPGENNAIVSSQLGFRYTRHGIGEYALALTALGSATAALASVILLIMGIDFLSDQTWIYSTYVKVAVFSCVYVLLILQSRGLSQVVLGSLLAVVGYSDIWGETTMLGMDFLSGGLSLLPVMMAIFVVPVLWNSVGNISGFPLKTNRGVSTMTVIGKWWMSKWSWIRSVLSGTVIGLIPGIGTVIVGNTAYAIERKISTSPRAGLVAAESSNNSAAVSSLVPLICFGIPITASEAVLVNILAESNHVIGMHWFMQNVDDGVSRLWWIYATLVVSAVISLAICWRMARHLAVLVITNSRAIFLSVITIMISIMIWQGISEYRLILDLATFLLLLPLGFWLQKYPTHPLLLSFLIFDSSAESFYGFLQLS